MQELWHRLPPSVRGTIRTLVTVALNGGAAALSSVVIDPDHFNLTHMKHIGLMFAAGAAAGVINWLRQSPWKTPDDRLMTTIARSVPIVMIVTLLGLAVLSMPGCGVAQAVNGRSTAQLTMPGLVSLHALEAVKALDVIRDTAIDAEAAKLTPTATARTVVTWHKSVLLVIKESPGGWRPTVLAGLDELEKKLSPADLVVYGPFIDGARVTVKGIIA